MQPRFRYELFVLKSLYFRSRVGCCSEDLQGEGHYILVRMKQISELILPQCCCLNGVFYHHKRKSNVDIQGTLKGYRLVAINLQCNNYKI